MSLIMEALKKVQQQRSQEVAGGPFFKKGSKRKEKKRRGFLMAGAGVSLGILLLALGWLFFPSSPSPPSQTGGSEGKESVLVRSFPMTPESHRDAEKPTAIEEPKSLPSEVPPSFRLSLYEMMAIQNQGGREGVSVTSLPVKEKTQLAKKGEEAGMGLKEGWDMIPPPPPIPKPEPPSKPLSVVEISGKENPLSLEVIRLFNMGVTSHKQREMTEAILAYQRALELDPSFVEAYNNLGILYQEIGDFEKALQNYQKAIEINPKYDKAFNNVGILLHLRGETDQAIEAFQKVLALNPKHIESLINLGTLYKKKGFLEKALESYQKALSLNPRHGETHYNLALLYEQMGNRDQAAHHYEQFILLASGTYPELASRVRGHLQQIKPKR